MNILTPMLIVLIGILLIGCQPKTSIEVPEPQKISCGVVQRTLTDFVVEVQTYQDKTTEKPVWYFFCFDTSYQAKRVEYYSHFTCEDFPDSLKKVNLKVGITGNVRAYEESSRLELIKVRQLSCGYNPNVKPPLQALEIKTDSPDKFASQQISYPVIIRDKAEYDAFVKSTGFYIPCPIDFSKQSIIGYGQNMNGLVTTSTTFSLLPQSDKNLFTFSFEIKHEGSERISNPVTYWVASPKIPQEAKVEFVTKKMD